MNTHIIYRISVLFIVLLINTSVNAEAHYVARMKLAQWDEEKLAETVERLQKHTPIKVADPLELEPFHHRAAPKGVLERDFCISCHTSLPHRQSERLRSYLNMHVNYLACASCHYQPQGVVLSYRWQYLDMDGHPETVQRIITPFYEQQAVTLTRQHTEIARLLESWETSDIRLKAQDHLRLHIPLQSEGVGCRSCHTTKTPLLDYRQLGYEEDAIKALVENRIARFLSDESFKERPIKLMDLLQ